MQTTEMPTSRCRVLSMPAREKTRIPRVRSRQPTLKRLRARPRCRRRHVSASKRALLRGDERFARMRKACTEARFDSATISQRLRDAASAGHEASLWQLGNLADIQTARRYWLSAAMLGFGPAQVDLAQNLMYHPTSKERGARAQMQYWLQAAAKQSWVGKVNLGECLIAGCNGQPPDTAAAAQQLREAVFLGAASAPEALASIPADDPAAPTDRRDVHLRIVSAATE